MTDTDPSSVRTPPTVVPLCVDLDGTLLRCDTLHEALIGLLWGKPLGLFATLPSLLHGKTAFKRAVASRHVTDPLGLPYTEDLLGYLRSESGNGRPLILVTAADGAVARAVADHLGLFDEVMASDGAVNMRGPDKAAALVARYGERGFDYAGNDLADEAVWRVARLAVVVNADGRTRRSAAAVSTVDREFGRAPNDPRAMARILRPHQWVKNFLVFVPIIAGHAYTDPAAILAALIYFVAFSATASGVYVLNDLSDLASDRRHPSKRRRPFAASDVSP